MPLSLIRPGMVAAGMVLAGAAAPTGVAADGKGAAAPGGKYAQCMALTRDNPEAAYRTALAWQDRGGGAAARHCVAVSLLSLGLNVEAARNLEEMAANAKSTNGVLYRELLGQAANAWLIAGRPEAAYAAQTEALKIQPNDVELLIDRSISLAAIRNYRDAVADLDRALLLEPNRSDALIFRASAYRRLDSLDQANRDIERALTIDPERPDGLLERGIIRHHRGDATGARRDWIRILELAPASASAEAARRNLEGLDVKID